jgi:hypothetical protein
MLAGFDSGMADDLGAGDPADVRFGACVDSDEGLVSGRLQQRLDHLLSFM